MSSTGPPLIRLVDTAARAFRDDMARAATAAGFPEVRVTHDAVFATLPADGARISAMAAQAGITKQSMAEIVRDLERNGIVQVDPDPSDGRAKLVTYTAAGWRCVRAGEQHIRDVEQLLADRLGEARLIELRAMLTEVVEALSAGVSPAAQ